MKKLLITLILLSGLKTFSQSDSLKRTYRHELGADITGLLNQFLNFGSANTNTNYYTPLPTYYLTYRYLLEKTSVRFGVGGNYSKNSISDYQIDGKDKVFYNTYTNVSVRIGYEFVSELSKRWQAFYGLDFRPSIFSQDNPASYSNGGYINGFKNASTTLGFAPLLGFRLRLNNRVSITTEASFSYNIQYYSKQRLFLSQNTSLNPYLENEKVIKTTNISASFSQPLFLILTVKI